MNKTAVKNFAVRARRKLIEDITQRAYEVGITKDEILDIDIFEGGFKVKDRENSRIFKKYEIKQRQELIQKISEKGFEQVVEEVAYIWFNRFIALRFMEVNEYLPIGVRVLSSIEENKIEPDILKQALDVDLDINKEIVYKLQDQHDTEDLYKYLLIKQCNKLGEIMPTVFEKIADYTELLLPDNLLTEGSVIRDLVESIEEEDYKDQVEIVGWMYQYYISEKKDEVFAGLKKNRKITKENIPAATQLFTPKWIVKYMVENSLGRLWLESHPDDELKEQWKYYLEEAEQDPEVQKKLEELKNPNLNPEDIKVLDPCMGSGHILVYAFDVLYDIYLKAGYSEREIPRLILEKNLYGLDIDDRAGQLSAFALMMKSRSKNRRIFRKKVELNICSIQESNGIPKGAIDYLVSPKDTAMEKTIHRDEIEYLIEVFIDAKEYGSILNVEKIDLDAIEKRVEEIRDGETIDLFELQFKEIILGKIPYLIKQAKIMSEKYDVVCTNPPYMGLKKMNINLAKYIQKIYPNSKSDLSSVFIEKCNRLCNKDSFISMVTQHGWLFQTSYEKLRQLILNVTIHNLIHLGARGFEEIGGEVVQTVSFVFRKNRINGFKAKYFRLTDYGNQQEKEYAFLNHFNEYVINQERYKKVMGSIIAYWLSNKMLGVYNNRKVEEIGYSFQGIITGNTEKYLRFWHEVDKNDIYFNLYDSKKLEEFEGYIPYIKGGTYRRWYGNLDYILHWKNNGIDFVRSRTENRNYFLKEGITWSDLTTGNFSARYVSDGFTFDASGPMLFVNKKNDLYNVLGYFNSKVFQSLLNVNSQGLHYGNGAILSQPIRFNEKMYSVVNELVSRNILLSKNNWDSFETSWDFKQHPLIVNSVLKNDIGDNKLETAFNRWIEYSHERFKQLKNNEEELNRIFIDIYGLQDELTPEVEDKDITISKADRERYIKSFISYAVGCMFGRYSLDEEGLVYAGGEFDIDRYKTFIPTYDNVLVIADDDYFEDDIVNRFVDFVKVTFGEKTLEENLDYIADTLGSKSNETSRQTIRRYFLKDFYKNHIRTYSKRPIYWLFDSGKENGFKALIYMHRYDSSTVARVRTDYLHKLQKKYEAEIMRLDILIDSDISTREKAAARKKKEQILKQIHECVAYDQAIAHVANQKIEINLDDGVKINYAKFQGIEIPQGEGKKPLKANLLAKI